MPIVQKGHQLLVTLLLCNALAMEALPLFLDQLVRRTAQCLWSVQPTPRLSSSGVNTSLPSRRLGGRCCECSSLHGVMSKQHAFTSASGFGTLEA
jgi:hypothetical protein